MVITMYLIISATRKKKKNLISKVDCERNTVAESTNSNYILRNQQAITILNLKI